MALITTLIPAYKKDYLGEVFLGLRRQTLQDFKVIVSDDSPGAEISALIASGHFGSLASALDLEVVRGPCNARLNQRALLERWDGSTPYVHLHLDDDLIYPDFYRQHAEAHQTGRFACSVSRRWITHMDTRPVMGIELPRFVAQSPMRLVTVDEHQLFQSMVPTCNNWMGEFSNMLLSAGGLKRWPRAGRSEINYYGWPDVGFLLEAVQDAPIVYLRDHLSVFRQHPQQTTHNMQNHGGRVSSIAWAAYALQAWYEQRIQYPQAVNAIMYTVKQALERYGDSDPVLNQFFDLVQRDGAGLDRLYTSFKPFWLSLLASHPATAAPEHTSPALMPAAEAAIQASASQALQTA